jgi:hypothetical protein
VYRSSPWNEILHHQATAQDQRR